MFVCVYMYVCVYMCVYMSLCVYVCLSVCCGTRVEIRGELVEIVYLLPPCGS